MTLSWVLKLWEWLVKYHEAIFAMLLSFVITGLVLASSHFNEKYKSEVKAHTEYVKAQEVRATEVSLEWQAKMNRVNEEFVDRVKNLTVERDGLLANAGVLKGDLDTAKRKWASVPESARTEYANTLSDVYKECVTEYTALAVKADGHVLDAERLRDSWISIDEIKKPP